MASISSLNLQLVEHDHRNRTATLRVSYRVILSAVERNMVGLRFRERIQLWGSDQGEFLLGGDDFQYEFSTSAFNIESDGVVNRERTVTLADDILDEDGILYPTDEIFAKVIINPILPQGDSARSNVIEHRF